MLLSGAGRRARSLVFVFVDIIVDIGIEWLIPIVITV